MIQKLFNILFKQSKPDYTKNAVLIPRTDHCISRKHINPHAVKVLYRLHDAGFDAYLVGGGVRDLLLNRKPKDFDVATNAKPEEVKKLFRNCLLIGRRFRIAHVRFGQDIIEVTTFRSSSGGADDERAHSKLGMLLRDNVYGSIGEDAARRDFTINSLYYNIADFSVTDFANGMVDLQNKVVRLIGKPQLRYQEDPVRILRAIRFAAKLNFTIEPETEAPIAKSGHLLAHVAPARLFDEFLKLFFHGHARDTYFLLQKYDLLKYLLPADSQTALQNSQAFVEQALIKTDERVDHDQSVNPAFLLAVFLWPKFVEAVEILKTARLNPALASQRAISKVLSNNELPMAIPKRFTEIIRDIWLLQWRFSQLVRHQGVFVSLHKRFRAGYDFLVLCAAHDPKLMEAATWWTHYQASNHETQQLLLEQLPLAPKKKKRRPVKRKKSNDSKNRVHSSGE